MTHDSYCTILVEVFKNHILAENTFLMNHLLWTDHKIMVLKPASKYRIIQQYHNFQSNLINNFQDHSFFYWVKVLQTSFFHHNVNSNVNFFFARVALFILASSNFFLLKFSFLLLTLIQNQFQWRSEIEKRVGDFICYTCFDLVYTFTHWGT